ncbi:LuxR C-terminal-related transcriptional regulator [Streptomyces europaeiscabiei]|uniref:helix-turn-helix transcriptional regulator n=1 Tax=Streptomyces europaeiscabiei TaxID=146819 RepID=UPI0029A8C3EC|nr:LuxR C-terminal-related transcriptional regulator [Streptomyces europaeiscabiei]MDX3696554.1 LuxR C-terminal-related transcriptional regulator [Streptomyces europaeiscabiei]
MTGIDWREVARFGELACGSLQPVTVQRRTLPELVRLLRCDSGAIHLIDRRYRGRMATVTGAPVQMLLEFETIAGPANPYFERSSTSRFPVHDALLHGRPADHLRSPVGRVLAGYGFEHCLFALLVAQGRPVGTATLARRAGRPRFTPQEQDLAHRLSRFLSIGLSNAAAYDQCAPGAVIMGRFGPDHDVDTVDLSGTARAVPAPSPGAHGTLTEREREVLALATDGLINAEIAAELGIAVNTVKQHLRHAFHKLGVRSRLEALRYLQQHT